MESNSVSRACRAHIATGPRTAAADRRRRSAAILLILAGALLFVSCAAGPNSLVGTPVPEEEEPARFLNGLWHGFITPFAFIVSLFNKSVNVYEVHNNGGWYNFGFVIGVSIIFGGGGGGAGAAGRGRRRRDDD